MESKLYQVSFATDSYNSIKQESEAIGDGYDCHTDLKIEHILLSDIKQEIESSPNVEYNLIKQEEEVDIPEDDYKCDNKVKIEEYTTVYTATWDMKPEPNIRHQKTCDRKHTSDKPYYNSHCGKSFTYKSKVLTEQRVHTFENQYKCKNCDRYFVENLARHQIKCNVDKPYKCSLCNKRFGYKRNLVRHQEVKHTYLEM